ncbi:MAG TPA: NAD(P)-binding domain-containing protein, partial [Candidatus Acidoferrum sp.]|nr:NAD(P)-binding domain-containing protein [Candidatus Acidoferrum sp.]
HLGSRVASRLAAAGFPLTVWDRDSRKTAGSSAPGVAVAESISELARGVDRHAVVSPAGNVQQLR